MVSLLEDQCYINETAINLGVVLGSKNIFRSNQRLAGSLYINQEEITKHNLMQFMSNYVCRGIDPTTTGINIHEANFWEGFMSMIDDDSLIHQTLLILRPYNEIAEVFYFINSIDVDFFILLDNKDYDSSLMRSLIKKEKLISSMWQGRNLDFHYAPIKHIDKSFVLRDYKIAYKKG